MRILKLTAENVKKLRVVEISPTGDVVQITGKNGQGKTSVLDAIWWVLAGTKHIQATPIRKGQNKARIRLDLGELVVERRFTEKGSVLSVETDKGAKYGSPQTVLDALLGELSFDPLDFVSQDARKQFETLRRIVPLDVDVDELDALNRGDFDRRTEINRDARSSRAKAEGITVGPDVPRDLVDEGALLAKIRDAAKTNTEIEAHRTNRGRAQDAISDIRVEAARSRNRAKELRAEAERLESEATVAELSADRQERELLDLPALPALVDVDAATQDLERAQAVNKLVEQRQVRDAHLATGSALEEKASELTASIEARQKVKADAIAKAPMPVAGLGFGDGVVLFGGIPFDQASTAEQLRVSLAIAMAANPKLRVIRIKEGSLLDKDGQRLIAEMAQAHDYQLWVEQVDDSGKMGFYIEDGQVVAVDGEPVTQQPQPEPETKTETKPVPSAGKPRPSSPW
jgi:hypothetical protein